MDNENFDEEGFKAFLRGEELEKDFNIMNKLLLHWKNRLLHDNTEIYNSVIMEQIENINNWFILYAENITENGMNWTNENWEELNNNENNNENNNN